MAELAIFISVRTKAGKRDQLRVLWEQHLKERAAENEHQSTYIYAYDLQNEDLIHITEVYETMAAFEGNSNAEWFSNYMIEAASFIDGEPVFHIASPQWINS